MKQFKIFSIAAGLHTSAEGLAEFLNSHRNQPAATKERHRVLCLIVSEYLVSSDLVD